MPKVANDKLPEGMAQVANDLKTASGELFPFKRATTDLALPLSSYESFFEYIDGTNSDWAYYDGLVFHARSPVADDTFNRTYFLGESGLPAQGTLTVDTVPTATDTMTINTTVYTFVAVGALTNPGDIEIGLNAIEAQENITAAIEGTDGVNTAHTTVNIAAWSSDAAVLEYYIHGTAGNSIVTTETFTAGTNVFDAGTLGTTQAGQNDDEYRAFANDIDSTPWDFQQDYYLPGADAGSAPTLPAGAGATYIAYFYSYVSRYGEEGPGSGIADISTYTVGSRQQVNDITYPNAEDEHLITKVGTNRPKVRVYRTADDGAGGAAFLKVCDAYWFDQTETYVAGEYVFYGGGGTYDLYECTVGGTGTWAGGTHTFVQGEQVAVADLGTTAEAYLYRRCPDGLDNLRSHPNGFFVASKGNTLYFSEPFAPWAWPEDYEIPLDTQIVGLGVYGTTVVVATDGNTYTFTGPHPNSLYKQRLGMHPCLSQRAVVETDLGVMFPAKAGFWLVAADSAPKNVTAEMFKPEDWEDYELEAMHGAWYNQAYYGFYKTADYQGNIVIDFLNGSITGGGDYHYATNVSYEDGTFRTIFESNLTTPSVLNICKWDNDPTSYRNYTFKTARYVLEKPANFKVAQLILDTDWYADVLTAAGGDLETLNSTTWASNPATNWGDMMEGPINDACANCQDVNGDLLFNTTNLGLQDYVEFKVYVDGDLKWSRQVDNSKMFKLPRGFKHKKWEFEVVGMVPCKRITIATSTEEIV